MSDEMNDFRVDKIIGIARFAYKDSINEPYSSDHMLKSYEQLREYDPAFAKSVLEMTKGYFKGGFDISKMTLAKECLDCIGKGFGTAVEKVVLGSIGEMNSIYYSFNDQNRSRKLINEGIDDLERLWNENGH